MIKKIVLVVLSLVVMFSCFVLSPSAAVTGDISSDSGYTFYLPFNITYTNQFNVDTEGTFPAYSYGVLSSAFNSYFATSVRDGATFGSEDYRHNLAEFVIYRPWTNWGFQMISPIRYDTRVDYDTLMPELRTGNVECTDIDGFYPFDGHVYFSTTMDINLTYADGSTFTYVIDFDKDLVSTNGYYVGTIKQDDYGLDDALESLHTSNESIGGIYCINWMQSSTTVYQVNENGSVPAILFGYDSSYAGYTFCRPLTTLMRSRLGDFSPVVKIEYLNASSWFDWLGHALTGVFDAPLFVIPINDGMAGFPVTIGGLFGTVLAVMAVFFVLRAFAGG